MNRILTIVLLLVLSLPISVWAVDDAEVETINNDSAVETILDKEIEKIDITNSSADETLYKQPISKRKIAKKFLAAMGGVVASSLILFILLTIYNKIRDNIKNRVKTPDGEVSLQTPDDIKNAIKTFLEITKF